MAEGRQEMYLKKVANKLELIEGWARTGQTNLEISRNLGISVPTLEKYIAKYEGLADAILMGREGAEVLVENALFKKAIGYQYREVTRERVKVYEENDQGKMAWNGEYKVSKTREVVRSVAADTAAIIYWLEHRVPKRWKHVIEQTENEPIEIVIKRKDGQVTTVDLNEEEI